MQTYEYSIASEVFAAHPQYCRGVVVIDAADNEAKAGADELQQQLRAAEAQLRTQISGNVAEHPRVAAWREAYRRFGAKPSEHRSAIEALSRRVLQPNELPTINPLVDIGNIVSLRHLLPAGVHPWPEGGTALALRAATAADRYTPPDNSAEETPPPGEIVFACGTQVLTRRWTWRQAAGTQTLPQTRRVFFNIDGLPPTSHDNVEAAMADVLQLVGAHCGGQVLATAVLTAEEPTLTWRA